jgi:hypothetical protein
MDPLRQTGTMPTFGTGGPIGLWTRVREQMPLSEGI